MIDHGDGVAVSPRDVCRQMIVDLGYDRVAAWCGVPRNTLYQWLKRGTDDEPIPLKQAMVIFDAARFAGFRFDIRRLAPFLPDGPL